MRRRKKDSGLKTALLLIVAIIFMIMAISVIVIVFGKIHSDYEKLDMTRASENRHWKYRQLRQKKRISWAGRKQRTAGSIRSMKRPMPWISGWK